MSSQKDYSMATADLVDAEVRELVETAYSRAKHIMTTHIDILHKLAQLLIEKETVDGEEFMSLFIDGKAELFVAWFHSQSASLLCYKISNTHVYIKSQLIIKISYTHVYI